ncbi:uncharacterized protein [Pocillopora verrucosa]|uniref:uncharacterized protein n=1 Tax=Pocillopora verrucosa TaxID=203993 RepID=UPI00333FAE82
MAIPETAWIHLLDERAPHLIEEVAPTKLLPYLNLPKWDKENIVCDERNLGPAYATSTLLDKLKRRNGSKGWKTFDALVRALRNIGNQQSALLLDPHFKVPSVPSASEEIEDENCSRLGILGTAAEIGVRIRLVDEETKNYCEKLENEIWRKFQDTRSESTLELRNKLHEDLPEGAAFSALIQETKDEVLVCKLRVSQKSVAEQI